MITQYLIKGFGYRNPVFSQPFHIACNNGATQLKSAGVQHLDGIQAVAYGRLRLMDTDYARTERQRLVIQKAFEKAKQADLGLLNRILLMEVEQVETSLSFSDLTSLILDIGK